MKHVIHRRYEITVAANNEKRSGQDGDYHRGKRKNLTLHDPVCFPTEMEAEEHAIELDKGLGSGGG
jgi:hypothetical protein